MKTEASRFLKWLYCLTLITVIFPSGMYGAASWTGLAMGGGLYRNRQQQPRRIHHKKQRANPRMEGRCMRTHHVWLKRITKLGLILMMGVSMNVDAGLFGFGGTSWKEEVLLHDGSKIIVERSQNHGGRHEIGQQPPIKDSTLAFTMSGTNQRVTWKDEGSEDVGHANFQLLALHILNGTSYIVAAPSGCLSYNKWGRPNPPYIFFRYGGKTWLRISLSEFPSDFKEINLLIDTYGHYDVDQEIKSGFVSYASVKKLNGTLMQPEYKTILRETYPGAGGGCMEEIRTGDGWMSLDWFSSQKTYEACLKICEREKVSAKNCPCNKLFKGK